MIASIVGPVRHEGDVGKFDVERHLGGFGIGGGSS